MATKVDPSLTNPFLPAYSAPGPANYDPATGGIPATPNPLYTAKKAILGDEALFPELKTLGRKANDMLLDQYTKRLPGYSEMATQSSANINNLLKGEVPADVLYQLGQQAAERGVSQGVPGSQFANSEYLRALGLTSLDLQKQGETEFTGAMGRIKDIPFFDISKYLVTPEAEQTAGEKAATLAGAPNPSAAAAAEKRNLTEGLNAGSETPKWQTGVELFNDPTSPFYNPNLDRKF